LITLTGRREQTYRYAKAAQNWTNNGKNHSLF